VSDPKSSEELAQLVAEKALERSVTVGVAESLTSGATASALGAAPDASDWFRGGIVAYSSAVKRGLLRVPDGPVVSEQAVVAMAAAAAVLLDADLSLAITGVGGPETQDGEPLGTVWFCVRAGRHSQTTRLVFDGSPETVVRRSVTEGLRMLLRSIEAFPHQRGG
jgi:nicotinamide-nucleotide amidase